MELMNTYLGKQDSKGLPTDYENLNANCDDNDEDHITTPWQTVVVFSNPDFHQKQEFISIQEAEGLRKKFFVVCFFVFNNLA